MKDMLQIWSEREHKKEIQPNYVFLALQWLSSYNLMFSVCPSNWKLSKESQFWELLQNVRYITWLLGVLHGVHISRGATLTSVRHLTNDILTIAKFSELYPLLIPKSNTIVIMIHVHVYVVQLSVQ